MKYIPFFRKMKRNIIKNIYWFLRKISGILGRFSTDFQQIPKYQI